MSLRHLLEIHATPGEVITELAAAGHWQDGDLPVLVAFGADYDVTRLAAGGTAGPAAQRPGDVAVGGERGVGSREVVPLVAPAADVIVPDRRGFGESDKHAAAPAAH